MSFNELDEFDEGGAKGFNFDILGFAFKALSYWWLIVICVSLGLFYANYINVRKQNQYRLSSLISIESEQNPSLISNTNISFNWGGVPSKTGRIITALRTRKHNTKVVDSLEFYIQYLKQGKYRKDDFYTKIPFDLEIDKTKGQALGSSIGIKFLNDSEYELFVDFESDKGVAQKYDDKTISSINTPLGSFRKKFKLNETVNLPFFNGKIKLKNNQSITPGEEYFIGFLNFDNVVSSYINRVQVAPYSKTVASVLKLTMSGNNKPRIVAFLNATIDIFSKTELEQKNIYATNTIKFIEQSLASVNDSLKDVEGELNAFRKQKRVINIDEEIISISEQLREIERSKETEEAKLFYLDDLDNYLRTKTDYTKIAAPNSVGIEEGNILFSVSKIISLAVERQKLELTTREGSPLFVGLDKGIDAEKNVLLEIIRGTKLSNNRKLNAINNNISKLQFRLSKLPEEQQQYLKIQRRFNINQEAYDVYLAKYSEANIIKAANISDIVIVDEAKDVGGGLIGPDKNQNYIIAIGMGVIIPMLLVFLIFILDTSIRDVSEVERLSKIPVLGLLGKEPNNNNLVVYEKPKSSVAEAFRSIRSSLQFFYKKQDTEGGKTLMITSSISGEGKTFSSINIATVYALSGKKTILLGLDLRKPKIFEDFDIKNDKGIVNHLINEETLDSVIHNTHIKNLDIILSGPIPPNPSELLMSDTMGEVIKNLREEYDIIVLDTPPLGLVSDALDLVQYADASIFMVRLGYTKKGMLQLINAKYKAGEIKNVSYIINYYKHKNNNYGYGYGYGYGNYGNSYHENDGKLSLMSKIKRLLKRKRN